jgi:hypothetical protein
MRTVMQGSITGEGGKGRLIDNTWKQKIQPRRVDLPMQPNATKRNLPHPHCLPLSPPQTPAQRLFINIR